MTPDEKEEVLAVLRECEEVLSAYYQRWSYSGELVALTRVRLLLRKLKDPAGEPTSDDAREGLRAGDEGRQSPDRDA